MKATQTRPTPGGGGVAAPRTTATLVAIFALGVFAQATFAGAFLGGHESWHSWHENLGNVLVLPPLASLLVGIGARRRQRDTPSMLASRAALVVLVALVIVTGRSGGAWLAVHIPAAFATAGLVVRQILASGQARQTRGQAITHSHARAPLSE
jgi:hypothetical protein